MSLGQHDQADQGLVLLADRHDDASRQQVAIRLLLRGFDNLEQQARFQRE